MRILIPILGLFIGTFLFGQEENTFPSRSYYLRTSTLTTLIDVDHSWSLSGAIAFDQNERKGLRLETNWFHAWENAAVRSNFNDIALTRKWYWPLDKVHWLGLELNTGLGVGRIVSFYDYYEGFVNYGFETIGLGPSVEFAPNIRINDRLSIYSTFAIKAYFGLERTLTEITKGNRIYSDFDLGFLPMLSIGVGLKFDLGNEKGEGNLNPKKHLLYKKYYPLTAYIFGSNTSFLDLAYAFKFNEKWGIKIGGESINSRTNGFDGIETELNSWQVNIVALRNFSFEKTEKLGSYLNLETNFGVVIGRQYIFTNDIYTSYDFFDGIGPTISVIPTFQFSNWGAVYFDFSAYWLIGQEFDISQPAPSSITSYRFGFRPGTVGFRIGL